MHELPAQNVQAVNGLPEQLAMLAALEVSLEEVRVRGAPTLRFGIERVSPKRRREERVFQQFFDQRAVPSQHCLDQRWIHPADPREKVLAGRRVLSRRVAAGVP